MKLLNISISDLNYLTKKYVFLGNNGNTIESVYIDRIDKDIICISSMYGCPVRCKFCHSGKNYYGIVNTEDMIEMCNYIANDNNFSDDKRKVFSFMGSGEPLLNIENVGNTINLLSTKFNNYSISISISGAGIENLNELINITNILPKFQFSLHSPFNEERKILIPRTAHLDLIFSILNDFCQKFNTIIELNYILLNGINDKLKHIIGLSEILNKNKNFSLKINEYHKINEKYIESHNKNNFIKKLNNLNIFPEVYATDGVEIGAACGQLNSINY